MQVAHIVLDFVLDIVLDIVLDFKVQFIKLIHNLFRVTRRDTMTSC